MAIAAPELSIAGDPRSPDFGWMELINAAEALTRTGEARLCLKLYELWQQHHLTDPLRYAVCFNHGALLAGTGQHSAAATAYEEVIRLAPDFLPAYINGGLALESLGLRRQAIDQWQRVADRLAIVDGNGIGLATTALKHIARVCLAEGDVAAAEAAFRRSLDIEPHQRDAIASWIVLRQLQCLWPAVAPWGRLTRADLMAAIAPMSLAIQSDDPMLQLANAWRHSEVDVVKPPGLHTAGGWPAPEAAPPMQRPLRVGYVSVDLREHAIGFLTAELFELHDRAKVEVFAYYAGPGEPDPIRTQISEAVDHWTDIAGWSARDKARQIVGDEIDILVDIDGHTEDSQAPLFALRPAPVIVNWLGYPGSMGTPHHHYIIADNEIVPPDYEKFYSERVLRLPCYQPTDRRRLVATPSPSRSDVGLADDVMVYCCFNASHKITSATFRSWMAILHRVPDAVLWLLSGDSATDERLRQRAASHGVCAERVVFAPRVPNAAHLARYPLADLFLDTSPYGAHTTASDALWMGVPVLCQAGHSFASRVCASLVRAAGLAELVCGSRQEYEDRAVELAIRADWRRTLQATLQTGRDSCLLFDMPLLVTRLEALFEQMWNEYLTGRMPIPDLSNLSTYADIGGGFDFEPVDRADLQAYERHYVNALAYRDSVSPLPADHRLWGGSRSQDRRFLVAPYEARHNHRMDRTQRSDGLHLAPTRTADDNRKERLDHFMARANAAYYATHDPFADFTTAPEISQVFGELLGLWAAVTWRMLGAPSPVSLVEAGPGRGTLMADALRAIAGAAPEFRAAATVHLIETSPRLRAMQRERIADAVWHDALDTVPDAPLVLLGNEFLDALPIRQFVRRGAGWTERFVGPQGFIEGPAGFCPAFQAAEGEVAERCETAEALAVALAVRVARQPGAALFLDYGPEQSGPGDSLQAIEAGRPADPLVSPGAADLTAHVDFARFANAASAAGAQPHGPVAQGLFLARLGLFQRTNQLARHLPSKKASAIIEGARRLGEPNRMGRLFKAIALVSPGTGVPPGFD